jgi:hypothetical protein
MGDVEMVPPRPQDELNAFVVMASGLFLAAERGHNPQVNSFLDAYHYIATSLSVGYANIFPVTPLGRLIGAVTMIVGPTLSARALDRGDATPAPPPTSDPLLLARLDEILVELRALNQRGAAPHEPG